MKVYPLLLIKMDKQCCSGPFLLPIRRKRAKLFLPLNSVKGQEVDLSLRSATATLSTIHTLTVKALPPSPPHQTLEIAVFECVLQGDCYGILPSQKN